MKKKKRSFQRNKDMIDQDALKEAYSGVKPLKGKGKRFFLSTQRYPSVGTEKVPNETEDEIIDQVPNEEPSARLMPFHIEWDSDGEVTAYRQGISSNEIRGLRRQKFKPGAQLDLHGLRVKQVESTVTAFIRSQYERGIPTVLVIHGKGKHSEGGKGVLSDRLVQTLTKGRVSRYVRAFCCAGLTHGGKGATVVLLSRKGHS